jgi:hypothetical protein
VGKLLRVAVVVLVAYAGLLFLTARAFTHTPTGYIPPQDQGYRAFITELHRRMQAAGSTASLTGGIGMASYATAVTMLALLAVAMVGLLVRALATSEFTGALFLIGIAIWFAWTIGGFIKRNRPRGYSFDALPGTLLP